jgi:cell division protein FtsQ
VTEQRADFARSLRVAGSRLTTGLRGLHPVTATRRGWRRVMARKALAVVVTVLVVITTGGIVFASGAINVRHVEVVGASRPTAVRIDTLVHSAVGSPMLTVDTSQLTRRVESLPQVSHVHVQRSWPNTLRVFVAERQPVLAVHGSSGWTLIDTKATPYLTAAALPAHVLTLTLPPSTTAPNAHDPDVHAAVDVVAALPAVVRASVVGVEAPSVAGIRLRLRDGSIVVWGGADDSARKAHALAVLLHATASAPHKQSRARLYDVSTPGFVTTS